MIQRDVHYFRPAVVACDARCDKAWGFNARPHVQLCEDEDDLLWFSDDDLGTAPVDPGTYEGGHGKPRTEYERLNKWCVRACERSVIVDPGQPIVLNDFSKRWRNMPLPINRT